MVGHRQEMRGLFTMGHRQRSRNILEAIQNLVAVVEGLDQGQGRRGSSSLRRAQGISSYLEICRNLWITYVKARIV